MSAEKRAEKERYTEQDLVNAIRVLAIDQVDAANSGHPGLPLGAAPLAYTLFAKAMKHSPSEAQWFDRDRFVLSAGHGSAMLYAVLHLFSYGLSMDDLKSFRAWGGRCHGHPEYNPQLGIEMTTGPLGQGISTAVGLALAERHLAARFNRPDYELIDHYTYVLAGDGCMMEGVSGEACSLAGTLGLGKLIVLYDDNGISIDGSTDLAFREDVRLRYESYGWQVTELEDGNDIEAMYAAILRAKEEKDKPSLIIVPTQIGFASPLAGQAKVHGAPLGTELSQKTREALGWPLKEPFALPSAVVEAYKKRVAELNPLAQSWNELFSRYEEAYPEEAKLLSALLRGEIFDPLRDPAYAVCEDRSLATRESSFLALNRLAALDPFLVGGSADLAGSNKTDLKDLGFMEAGNYAGRNIHFGVREHAMAAVCNGLALHGLHPFCATFLVFSDYARGAMRLSALMKLPLIYVFTHDSIGVGEDGPTHEPIEQIANLRSLPDFYTFRPADTRETLYSYAAARRLGAPSALCLTRSATGVLPETGEGTLRGAYIYKENVAAGEVPELIMMATGSELLPASEAYDELVAEGHKVRLISCPCLELFEDQDAAYRETVLPAAVRARVAIEAASRQSWDRYIGLDGEAVCIDEFGLSAPAKKLFEHFGFTGTAIAERCRSLLKK